MPMPHFSSRSHLVARLLGHAVGLALGLCAWLALPAAAQTLPPDTASPAPSAQQTAAVLQQLHQQTPELAQFSDPQLLQAIASMVASLQNHSRANGFDFTLPRMEVLSSRSDTASGPLPARLNAAAVGFGALAALASRELADVLQGNYPVTANNLNAALIAAFSHNPVELDAVYPNPADKETHIKTAHQALDRWQRIQAKMPPEQKAKLLAALHHYLPKLIHTNTLTVRQVFSATLTEHSITDERAQKPAVGLARAEELARLWTLTTDKGYEQTLKLAIQTPDQATTTHPLIATSALKNMPHLGPNSDQVSTLGVQAMQESFDRTLNTIKTVRRTAAMKQEIAAMNQNIAAMNQNIAAMKQRGEEAERRTAALRQRGEEAERRTAALRQRGEEAERETETIKAFNQVHGELIAIAEEFAKGSLAPKQANAQIAALSPRIQAFQNNPVVSKWYGQADSLLNTMRKKLAEVGVNNQN